MTSYTSEARDGQGFFTLTKNKLPATWVTFLRFYEYGECSTPTERDCLAQRQMLQRYATRLKLHILKRGE